MPALRRRHHPLVNTPRFRWRPVAAWTAVTAALGALVVVLSDDALPTWPRRLTGIGFAAAFVALLASLLDAVDPTPGHRDTTRDSEERP